MENLEINICLEKCGYHQFYWMVGVLEPQRGNKLNYSGNNPVEEKNHKSAVSWVWSKRHWCEYWQKKRQRKIYCVYQALSCVLKHLRFHGLKITGIKHLLRNRVNIQPLSWLWHVCREREMFCRQGWVIGLGYMIDFFSYCRLDFKE